MKEYFELLSASPLFQGIDGDELESMLQCLGARTIDVPKGDPVFLEGDAAGFIGIVLEGSIQVVQEDFFGNRNVIHHSQEGDIFAEAFSFTGLDTMPVSGYAVKNSRVMLLSCIRMMTVCANACGFHNRLVKNLLQLVSRKNMMLSEKIRYMSKKTTREKLLAFLSAQAKQAGSPEFTIPFDRQALADYLGVERSAMSAEIGKLQKDGILQSKGSFFRITQ
jgi:CRP-like cAMP-binding protein